MYKQAIYERLRGTLTIDPMALDKELIEFPSLMLEAAEYAGDAIQRRDYAEQVYKTALAVAASELRESGEGAKGKPLSESAIASMAPQERGPQDMLAKLHDAKGDAAYWNALVSAMMTKQMAIKRLVDLTISGFITSGTMVRDARAEMAEKRTELVEKRKTEGRVRLARGAPQTED